MKTSSLANLRVICAPVIAFVLVTLSAEMMIPRARAFFVLTVTSTADSGPGSLRDAVSNANSGDTIMFNLSLPATVTLTTGEIAIAKTLTINGPGGASLPLIVNDAAPGPSIVRVFAIAISPVVKVIVAGVETLNIMVSPELALLTASLSDPVPLSFMFITVTVKAFAGFVPTAEFKAPNAVSVRPTVIAVSRDIPALFIIVSYLSDFIAGPPAQVESSCSPGLPQLSGLY